MARNYVVVIKADKAVKADLQCTKKGRIATESQATTI